MNRTRRKGLKFRDRNAARLWPEVFPKGCGGLCCSVLCLRTKDGGGFLAYVATAREAMAAGRASKEQREALLMADLFQPVTFEQAQAIRPEITLGDSGEWFTCRWWDPETTLCRNHDMRPYVCKEFECRRCDYAAIVVRNQLRARVQEEIAAEPLERVSA